MNVGPVELLVLFVGLISMLGPVMAGAYLAARLTRRQREGEPTG
jgi:hypothetical protein